jgi:hypothetical protein
LNDCRAEGQINNYELVNVTVSHQTEFEKDKLERTRDKDCIKQHFVKLSEYDETFVSWVNVTDIKKM